MAQGIIHKVDVFAFPDNPEYLLALSREITLNNPWCTLVHNIIPRYLHFAERRDTEVLEGCEGRVQLHAFIVLAVQRKEIAEKAVEHGLHI